MNQYILRDNGLRCFIPPCFSWEVVEVDSNLVKTVSEVDLSELFLESNEAKKLLESLSKGELYVQGRLSAIRNLEWFNEGIRFSVTKVLGSAKIQN
jgi:hypothetical protein